MNEALRWLLNLPQDAMKGVDDWAPRFVGLPQNLWLLMLIIAVFAALVWLTIRSYRREGHTHRTLKMSLAGVRTVTLVLLLLVALQPALVLRQKTIVPTEVVVLVDDSLSMRWADRYGDSTGARLLMTATGATADDLGGEKRLNRSDLVKRVLAKQGGIVAQLAQNHPVSIFRFGGGSGWSAYAEAIAPTEVNAKLNASGYETNLGRAVRDALDKLEGRRIAAVILVSDGQNTAAGSAARLTAAKDLLRSRGVPLYSVGVGDPEPPRNLVMAQLQAPNAVRKGSTISFTAQLSGRGYAGSEVTVELHRAPIGSEQFERAGAAEKVTLPTQQDEARLQEVVLRTEALDTGEFTYKAVVTPKPDEMITIDNEARASVRVSDEKVAVLIISGDGGWEFQFIRNYLLKHPEHYRVSTWQQNADPAFNQDASSGMKLTVLPSTREELQKYDCIIMHDPRCTPGSFDTPFLSLLDEFVSKHHGGICYIAGGKFTETNLLSGGPFDPLNKLLPVVIAKEGSFATRLRTKRQSFPLEVTPDGLDHPMMQIGPTAEDSRKLWSQMPGVYAVQPVSRLKSLATALLNSTDNARQTLDGAREPALAIQYYGKGRVLYQGFDATWRWRYVDDTRAYTRYWANVIDFLSAGRLEKKRILISTGGETFEAGTDLRLRVEAYNRDFTPMAGKTFTVTLEPAGDTPGKPLDVVLNATRDGIYEGATPADRTGAFLVKAKANASGLADWVEEDVAVRRIEIRLPQEEFKRPEANFAALRDIAADESRFITLGQIDTLAARIPAAKQTHVTETPHTIWNSYLVLITLGLLLLTEWALRKLYHMV